MKGVLFGYNGTLFFDYESHKESWREKLIEMTEGKLDFDALFPDQLKEKGIPCNIATASIEENMQFYI